jgi:hypothetical protein
VENTKKMKKYDLLLQNKKYKSIKKKRVYTIQLTLGC